MTPKDRSSYADIDGSDQLKTIDILFTPDPRSGLFGASSKSVAGHYEMMEAARLLASVPKEVRIHFEAVRATFVYSYFAYRIAMVAQTCVFSALELALAIRLDGSAPSGIISQKRLGQLMRDAIEKNILRDEAFGDRGWRQAEDPAAYCRSLADYWTPTSQRRKETSYPGKRNSLVHNPVSLDIPGHAAETIRQCADIINYIFRPLKGDNSRE